MPKQHLLVNNIADAGLNSDLIAYDLPPEFLTNLKNIRISEKKLSPFGGYADIISFAVGFDPGYILYIRGDSGGDGFWIIAGNTAVFAFDGATLFNISSAAGYAPIANEDLWNGCKLADIPILNHVDNIPEYWPDPQSGATALIPLPWKVGQDWATAGESCRIMRSHKQYLFAMDLTGAFGAAPDGVRWSSPADIGGVPETWDHLDDTNVAGLTSLSGNGGKIIDGLSLRDAFVIYQELGITIFDFVPNSPYVWRIREQSTTFGLASINSVVEVKGNHYFISDGDIFYNNGTTIQSIMHNQIRTMFISDINIDAYKTSFAIKNSIYTEIWFCIPGQGSTHPNLAYIYNWRDSSWAIRDIPQTPSGDYGSKGDLLLTGSTWGDIVGTWDEQSRIWNASNISIYDNTILCAVKPNSADNDSTTGKLRILDLSIVESIVPYNVIVERIGFALGGLKRVTTITRLYPHMTGSGKVFIQIGSMEYQNGPVSWKPGVTFDPKIDRKVDIRSTGALHAYRFSNVDVDAPWSLSGFDIDFVDAGER